MKGFWTTKRIIFWCVFVVCLFFVLFVWRTFNSETFKRDWILTTNWVSHFRKWLDISWGTKLVYKIDFSKYEDLYSPAELTEVKKSIQEVILKNIDTRISTLWVSDYKSYIQNIWEETQVVVEIWWVADLDQAKEIIGKTVELEFRLENEDDVTPETIAQRKQVAEKIRADAILNPDKMIDLYANQESENIYARTISGTLAELPEAYKNNVDLLNSIPLNQISELIEGTYWQQYYNDENGNISTQDIGWFLTFKVTDRSSAASDGVTAQDIIAVTQANGLEYELTTDKSDRSLEEWKYVIENWKLTYAIGKVSEDDKTVAYDLRVLTLPKDQWEEALAAAKEQLAADPQAEIEWATELANTYVDEDTIKELIPDFAPALNEVVTYDSDIDVTYLVYTKDIKEAWENVYRFLEINGIADQAAFEDSLKNQVVYTIDEIFVQDRLWWKLAQWNDWSPLNGAYFTIAKSETTQLWEPCVGIEFNGKWKEIFCEVTTNNLGKSMGIFIWGQAVTIATIQAKICDWRAQISGGFDKERAINTAKELNSWNMPAPLILLQEEKVSPSLWDSAFEGALIATLVWVLAIILYIFFIYGWRKAIVTASTMVMFFVVLLAFLKLIDYALSLSGIAAIILSIWMAVDANILIFERMNEEVREWKTYLSAVKTASKRSWSAIRDGQISTLLIWVLLFAYGINMFKWFGSMIVLTALLTLIINVPFITDMLEIMYQNKKD